MGFIKYKDENGNWQEVLVIKGEPGENGYTPKRGEDYWTEADKAEMRAHIDEKVEEDKKEIDEKIEVLRDCFYDLDSAYVSFHNKVTKSLKDGKKEASCLYSNALRGSTSGAVIAVSDISPVEHTMAVKVSSKNLFSFEKITTVSKGINYSISEDGNTFTFWKAEELSGNNAVIRFALGATCKDCSNKTFTAKVINNSQVPLDGYAHYMVNNKSVMIKDVRVGGIGETTDSFVVPENTIEESLYLSFYVNPSNLNIGEEHTLSNIQVEEGNTATDYTPHVDFSTTKLIKYARNVLDIDKGLNGNFVKNDDGTYTLTKRSSSNRMSAEIPFDFPDATFSTYAEIVDTNIESASSVQVVVRNAGKTKSEYAKLNKNGAIYTATMERTTFLQMYIDSKLEDGSYITFKNPQIVVSDTPVTNYTPYSSPVEYQVLGDGTVEGVTSLYPATTLLTDVEGAIIDCEYNRDINKAFAQLQQAILSLGGNV